MSLHRVRTRRRGTRKSPLLTRRFLFELLEARNLLSGSPNYLPLSHMVVNSSLGQASPVPGQPIDIALNYLNAHLADFGLTAADVAECGGHRQLYR